MRTDFKLDNKAVHLPNASTLGFGKYRAKRGDFIGFTMPGGTFYWGRVIGRVNTFGLSPVHGHIMAACLSSHGAIMVRWVEPKDVTLCYEQVPPEILLLLSADFRKLPSIEHLMSQHVTDFSLGRDPV
jgi:hypothetical protein